MKFLFDAKWTKKKEKWFYIENYGNTSQIRFVKCFFLRIEKTQFHLFHLSLNSLSGCVNKIQNTTVCMQLSNQDNWIKYLLLVIVTSKTAQLWNHHNAFEDEPYKQELLEHQWEG